jgi:hypothetical protein
MDITEDDYNFLPVWLAPAQRVRPARVDMHRYGSYGRCEDAPCCGCCW